VLFVVGIASFGLEPSDASSRDEYLFGSPAAVVSIANFATGLTCCALLAGLTVLGDAIMRGIRDRRQDASVRPPA
jgi:hypothetical protein